MHPSKRQLGTALAPLLKARGFRKRALTWHRANRDTIQVFHVEKNRWGADDYSFHLAIYLKACGHEITPPHYRCPIQTDLEDLVPNPNRLRRLSNFDDLSITLEKRLAGIGQLVSNYGLPWLDMYSLVPALQRLATLDYDTLLPKVRVFRSAYEYLRGLPQSR